MYCCSSKFFSFFLGILLLSRKQVTVVTIRQPPYNSYFMVVVTAYLKKLIETTWKSVFLVNLVVTLTGNFLNKIYVLEKLSQYQTNSKWDQKLLWVLCYISIQAININFYLITGSCSISIGHIQTSWTKGVFQGSVMT